MTIRLTLAALLALGATPLLAATPKTGPVKTAGIKTDPRVAAEFKARDLNHDGVLSRAEVAASIARMQAGKSQMGADQTQALTDLFFLHADANDDGKITLPEMQGLMVAVAARADTNHDGVVSVAEQRAAQARMMTNMKNSLPPGR
jgi:hypothetical protein